MLSEDPERLHSVTPGTGFHDGARGFFSVVQAASGRVGRDVLVISTDGRVMSAWRDPDRPGDAICGTGAVAIGDGYVGMTVVASRSATGNERAKVVYLGTFESIRSRTTPHAVIGDDVSSPLEGLVESDMSSAYYIGRSGLLVVTVDVRDGATRRMPGLGSEILGLPQQPVVAGRQVFWQDWGQNVSIAHALGDDPESWLLREPDTDFLAFSTDGVDMAWAACFSPLPDGSCERNELWTAPYVERAEDLRPRRVAVLPHHVVQGFVGGGYFGARLLYGEGTAFELWRLSDGEHRRWVLPNDIELNEPLLWLTESELAVSCRLIRPELLTMFRVDIATLPVVTD